MELDTALLRQIEKSILLDTMNARFPSRRCSRCCVNAVVRRSAPSAACSMKTHRMKHAFRKSKKSSAFLRPSARMAVRGTIFEYKNRGGLSTPDLFIHSK